MQWDGDSSLLLLLYSVTFLENIKIIFHNSELSFEWK